MKRLMVIRQQLIRGMIAMEINNQSGDQRLGWRPAGLTMNGIFGMGSFADIGPAVRTMVRVHT